MANKWTILRACPKLPVPDGDCATKAAIDVAPDIIVNMPGTGSPAETATDLADAGISAFQAYKECKDGGDSSDPNRGNLKNISKSQLEKFLRMIGETPHSFKEQYVKGNISHWDVYFDTTTRKIWLVRKTKYGDELIETAEVYNP